MALLGDDGRGYELARKLDNYGVWRTWLGDSNYINFAQSLSSPSTWESFMSSDESKSRAMVQLQLRVRALLFDKASISLFLRSPSSSDVSRLNPAYLQLHGDDVYFTLEDISEEGFQPREGSTASNTTQSKTQSKATFSGKSRFIESDNGNVSQNFRQEEIPDTWYNQFIQKYKSTRPYKLSFGDRESDKRSPEQMSTYLKLHEKCKRQRVPFREDQYIVGSSISPNSVSDSNILIDDNIPFFPETMFMFNSVPESALPAITREKEDRKMEFYGVLDTLPQVMTKSSIMLKRLGITEHLSMGKCGSQDRGKSKSYCLLGQERALKMSQKVLACMLVNIGFEGATEFSTEVLSQLLSCHISKLGRTLKVLSDNYRKQCSAVELIKMFLRTAGYSNLAVLAELVKDNTRKLGQQSQQQVQVMQPQMQSSNQNPIRPPQQIPRQMNPQIMQQMVHPQNLVFQQQQQQQQQQQERMRRRQPPSPRPGVTMNMNMNMNMDKDRPMVEVKLENPPDLTFDGNANAFARHRQMQFPQQHMAAMANQFRPMSSLQIPQIQTQNMGIVRAQPVKVEGFQELMGGDSTPKIESEDNRLTSPSK